MPVQNGGPGDDFLGGEDVADTLRGLGGDDTLSGAGGDDLLDGGIGADALLGGAGIDTATYANSQSAVQVRLHLLNGIGGEAQGDSYSSIERVIGSAFDDTLYGANYGNDLLLGGAGNDTLFGFGGDDTLTGGLGADRIDGGAGIDTLDFSAAAAAVEILLQSGIGVGGEAQGDSYTSIEAVVGSAFGDRLYGGAGNETLYGGGGNDILAGGAGGDLLDGGSGIDTANYGSSAGAVNVRLHLGNGVGGDANGDTYQSIERVLGSAFADTLYGAAGNEYLVGGGGKDLLSGIGGDDTLVGGIGADNLNGGTGRDIASFANSSGAVRVLLHLGQGQAGDAQGDTYADLEGVIGSAFDDTLYGQNYVADSLAGGAGDDTLFGFGGDDTLIGGVGADRFDGGSGLDIADFSASSAAVSVLLHIGQGQAGDAQGDTYAGLEGLIGSAFDDTLYGQNYVADTLFGGGGDDIQHGFGMNDTFIGDAGADRLDGGTGRDLVDFSRSVAAVSVLLHIGQGQAGDALGDTYAGLEGVIGSAFDDTLYGHNYVDDNLGGGAGNDSLYGLGGNDTLAGGLGADRLHGGGGDDTLVGGAGADTLDGGAGFDTADYSTATSGLNVNLFSGSGLGDEVAGDVLTGIERLIGSAYDDTLVGNAFANLLEGDAGRDDMSGGAGNDTVSGGAGNDVLYGGDGDDVLNGGAQIDRLYGGGGDDTLSGGAGVGHYYGGDGNDIIDGSGDFGSSYGGAGNDFLLGSSGFDTLAGGAGRDTLAPGEGSNDWLYVELGPNGDFLDLGDVTSLRVQADYTPALGVFFWLNNRIVAQFDPDGNNDLPFFMPQNLSTGELPLPTQTGTSAGEVLNGSNNSTNHVFGAGGDDTITGGLGGFDADFDYDTLRGGTGDDSITAYGGGAPDWLMGDEGNDTLTGGTLSEGGEGDDLILRGTRSGATLIGGAGNDTIEGGALSQGGTGNDRLVGAIVANGGDGADHFVYRSLSGSGRIIEDFDAGENDLIDLSEIDPDPAAGDQAFAFIGTAAFSGTGAEVRYSLADGNTTVSMINADGSDILNITLLGEHNLADTDFLL